MARTWAQFSANFNNRWLRRKRLGSAADSRYFRCLDGGRDRGDRARQSAEAAAAVPLTSALVMPAKAGIQSSGKEPRAARGSCSDRLDSRFRGSDEER